MKAPSPLIGTPEHLPSRVADYLGREIRSGNIAAGERLPPETTLAERLGVSRNVVREAIAQLRGDGLIHVRQGSGAYALAPEDSKVIRLDTEALSDAGELAQLFALRMILETGAAEMAAPRMDDAALARLGDALDRMQGDERTGEGSVAADLEFHREIARATGNGYIETFVGYIARQIRETIYLARRKTPVAEVVAPTIREHAAILEAMTRRDPAAARAAMHIHIARSALRAGADLPPSSPQPE